MFARELYDEVKTVTSRALEAEVPLELRAKGLRTLEP